MDHSLERKLLIDRLVFDSIVILTRLRDELFCVFPTSFCICTLSHILHICIPGSMNVFRWIFLNFSSLYSALLYRLNYIRYHCCDCYLNHLLSHYDSQAVNLHQAWAHIFVRRVHFLVGVAEIDKEIQNYFTK